MISEGSRAENSALHHRHY